MSNTTLPEEDLLIFFDQKQYERDLSYLESFIPEFNNAINRYNSLQIGIFGPDDFLGLFLDTENFLCKKTLDNIPDTTLFAGLKISKIRLYEMMEKPINHSILLADIRNMRKAFERIIKYFSERDSIYFETEKDFLQLFTFANNGTILLKASVSEKIKRHFEKHATSESGKKVFMFGAALKELIFESQIHNVPGKERFTEFLSSLIKFDAGTGDPIINSDYILSFNRR